MVAFLCVATLAFQYWNDPRIHNLGNDGARGAIHAMLAPLSTRIIDHLAYDGLDLRAEVLRRHVPRRARTVDFCCGVGYSTSSDGVGVDMSEQMLGVARVLHPKKRFVQGNAEAWRGVDDEDDFDVATCMFGMHEMPGDARRRVLANMLVVAPVAIVVDISPDEYTPSKPMLWGEPYLLDYQARIDEDVHAVTEEQGARSVRSVLVPGHAVMWVLRREDF